jgi:hypothetical protein
VPHGDLSGIKEINMKLTRIALVCTLLLLAATPSFALPCKSCDGPEYPYCVSTPNSGTRCLIGLDWCQTISASGCTNFTESASTPAVLAEWTVASVEVKRPAEGTKVVTSPAAVADAFLGQAAAQK